MQLFLIMIEIKLINFLQEKKIWFEEASESYKEVLKKFDISEKSDIGLFYLHAEQHPNFLSRNGELLQICWHAINTNYIHNSENIKKIMKIKDNAIILSSFEDGSGWFYDKDSQKVHLKIPENEIPKGNIEWNDFGSFLNYFFMS